MYGIILPCLLPCGGPSWALVIDPFLQVAMQLEQSAVAKDFLSAAAKLAFAVADVASIAPGQTRGTTNSPQEGPPQGNRQGNVIGI